MTLMMTYLRLPIVLAGLLIPITLNTAKGENPPPTPRLVLQITVDGLRGDLLRRYGDRFGEGGFRYLLDHGAVYTNAHYQHANTETIVGHTTLATGAFPADHGMIGNVWFDRESGELSYNIEDPEFSLLPTREVESQGAQVDPAQKISRTQGRSPRSIIASTLGDELAVFHAGRAKIYGVSGKDRGAVSMAGHVGKAFWFSTNTGDFVTSSFYYDNYPEWVARWNAEREAESHSGGEWMLMNDPASYLLGDFDDRPYETDLKGYGRTFPHPFGASDDALFHSKLLVSPIGDELALSFSKALITNEELGQDGVPDYLAISFSAVDAVNHFFGRSSLENEDVVLRLDRTLADLFAFINQAVGLRDTLIVLSADHGMPEMPEFMAAQGLPVGRLYPEDIMGVADDVGARKFGLENLSGFFFRPYLYLDSAVIEAAGLKKAEVEQAVAERLTAMDGIAIAVATSELPKLEDTPLIKQVRRNTHPSRSGDIYIVQEPYWFLYEKGPVAVMHGSPWRYDSYVPIIFAGANVEPQTIHRLVHPVDVAPTLAAFLGLKPPSSAVGHPLQEVLP
jgi:predicted AlkP superfamily pyrophosphatase or phosphodiesterase